MVNIYIEPGVGVLTAHFLTHLFYQGHYLPCGLPNNISRGLYLPRNKVQNFWIVFCWLYFRCCYITVDFAITALQTGACTYRCISKQVHYKNPFQTTAIWKVWNFMTNYMIIFCLEKIMWCSALWCRRSRFHCDVAAPYFLFHSPTGAYLSWPAVSLRKSKNNYIFLSLNLETSRDIWYRPCHKVHIFIDLSLI